MFRHRDTTKSTEPAAERPLLAVDVQRPSLARPVTFRPEKDREVGRLRGRWGLVPVRGGRGFVPMKTPLTRAQMASLKKSGKRIKYPHDLQGFVRDQAAQGRRVGLVIDLTCHDCLYESELSLCPGR